MADKEFRLEDGVNNFDELVAIAVLINGSRVMGTYSRQIKIDLEKSFAVIGSTEVFIHEVKDYKAYIDEDAGEDSLKVSIDIICEVK